MAITRFKDTADSSREYYRITRAWGGVEYQRYVRIKRSEQAALRKAQEIDQALAERQRAYQLRQALPSVRMVNAQGKIRGLARVTNHRAGRRRTEEFKLRVRHPESGDIFFTTISISHHGFDTAFRMAVEQILTWCGWQDLADLRQHLLACQDYYRDPQPASPLAPPHQRQPELQAFETGLRQAMHAYTSKPQRLSN